MRTRRRAILLGPVVKKDRSFRDLLTALRITTRDVLIGIDRGAELWLELGHVPTLAVGDWDSIRSPARIRDLEKVTLPRVKDESDLSHALSQALRLGAGEIVCLGVTGARPDHHLATLLELTSFSSSPGLSSVRAIGPEGEYHFIAPRMGTWRHRMGRERVFSVFALNGPSKGVSIRGAEYPLADAALSPSSHGLSNRALAAFCEIEVKSGKLLVVVPTHT